MSANLIDLATQQFTANVELLLQQKGSKLRNAVTVGMYKGKQGSPVNQIGAVNAQRVTQRFGPMPRVDAGVDRRWVYPVSYDLPQLIDTIDELKTIVDPRSAYATNAMYAMGRAMDDEIITAVFGTNKTGETGATSTTFTSGNIVGVNTGGTDSSLNVAKLRAAKKILMANEVDLENDPLFCIISADEHDALLGDIQVTSLDFNNKPVLVEGRVMSFMGFNFIHCERIPDGTDDQSGTSTAIPVWAKSGMHLGIWNDIQSRASQRNDLQNEPWQLYTTGSFGATRLQETKVCKIWCSI